MEFDLGSPLSFSLSEEILKAIDKTEYGMLKWYDVVGNSYESSTYTVPEIKIGNLTFANVIVDQYSKEFQINSTLIGDPLQFDGVIGLSILKRYNLLLDFPHSAVYACKDLSLLQKFGLLSNHLLAAPFTLGPDGMVLNVETDTGIHRLMLDTGTTTLVIRAPHPSSTAKFSIMGHDFGKQLVISTDLCPQYKCDGLIGMDFFCEHRIFIDYAQKMIFIDLEPILSTSY
jgi:hypothetical protein